LIDADRRQLLAFSILAAGPAAYFPRQTRLICALSPFLLLICQATGGAEAARRAVQEAAISAHMSHPNLVGTYTYCLQRLGDPDDDRETGGGGTTAAAVAVTLAGYDMEAYKATHEHGMRGGGGPSSGEELGVWKLTLVQELCDGNSLRHCLERGTLVGCRAVPRPQPEGIWARVLPRHVAEASTGGNDQSQQLQQLQQPQPRDEQVSAPAPGGMPLEQAVMLVVALQVVRGLAHLHSSAVVHADVCSTNVLLKSGPASYGRGGAGGFGARAGLDPCQYGYVAKLGDFGLSGWLEGSVTHLTRTARWVWLRGGSYGAGAPRASRRVGVGTALRVDGRNAFQCS
jgi:serine/threonine protein kinase